MKKMIICALALLLVFGCIEVSNPDLKEDMANQVKENTVITAPNIIWKDEGGISTIRVGAINSGGKWRFPVGLYENEFESAGLYSDSFIQINKTHAGWLDSDERIWITPMIRNGSGVIFNAIYSKEINSCAATTIRILGKDYSLENLKNGSSFNNDEKWKVLLDYNGGCLKRVVVSMDGYFYDIKEGQQINLFRNDNTILLAFDNLETSPRIRIVATKPLGEPVGSDVTPTPKTVNNTYIVKDSDIGLSYNESETINESGLTLKFQKPIGICSMDVCDNFGGDPRGNYYNSEQHRLAIGTPNGNWSIVKLWKDGNTTELVIAKEKERKIMNPYECRYAESNETLHINGTTWGLGDFGPDFGYENRWAVVFIDINNSENKIRVIENEIKPFGDDYLYVWRIAPGYTFCAKWVETSVFSEIINLTDSKNNVTVIWENETTSNPALKLIFIPRSSPIFEKLIGQSNS